MPKTEPSLVPVDTHILPSADYQEALKIQLSSRQRQFWSLEDPGIHVYLGHCSLQHNALDWQGSCIQHGHYHHQHIRPSRWALLGKVEEDAEAIFIIGCHRKGTACKKMACECDKSKCRRHWSPGGVCCSQVGGKKAPGWP